MGTPEWTVTLGSEPSNQTVALRWMVMMMMVIMVQTDNDDKLQNGVKIQ